MSLLTAIALAAAWSMHAPTLAALADRPLAAIAVACIAPVVYAEARGEPVAGMEAVAGVVLERARRSRMHPCTVVLQPHQFSVLVSGSVDLRSVAAAVAVAARATGPGVSGCAGATHFDARSAAAWTQRLPVLCRIGGHVFYGDQSR